MSGRTRWFTTGLVLLAAAGAGAPAGAQTPEAAPVARLAAWEGGLDVVRAGLPVALYPQLPLWSGDVLHVRDGRATLRLPDGGELRLKARTRLALSEQAGRRDVEVFVGRLWAFIASRRDRATRFKSGGTIVAVRGTTLEVGVGGDQTVRAGFSEGSGEYTHTLADGSVVSGEIATGTEMGFAPGAPPGPPRPFTAGAIAGAEEADAILLVAPETSAERTIDAAAPAPTVRFVGWVRCPGGGLAERVREALAACAAGEEGAAARVERAGGSGVEYFGCARLEPVVVDAPAGGSEVHRFGEAYAESEVEEAFRRVRDACRAAGSPAPGR